MCTFLGLFCMLQWWANLKMMVLYNFIVLKNLLDFGYYCSSLGYYSQTTWTSTSIWFNSVKKAVFLISGKVHISVFPQNVKANTAKTQKITNTVFKTEQWTGYYQFSIIFIFRYFHSIWFWFLFLKTKQNKIK